MITTDDIYQRLSTVIDPELGVNVVKLGLIYKVEVKYEQIESNDKKIRSDDKAQLNKKSQTQKTPLTQQSDKQSAKKSAAQTEAQDRPLVYILMTLTTPGCPMAAVFDPMIRDGLFGLPGLDPDNDVTIQLTFDPPWVPDMMDEETKAELGL